MRFPFIRSDGAPPTVLGSRILVRVAQESESLVGSPAGPSCFTNPWFTESYRGDAYSKSAMVIGGGTSSFPGQSRKTTP